MKIIPLLAVLVLAGAAQAATPAWTPQKAAASLRSAATTSGYTATCKRVPLGFRCQTTDGVRWAKVRTRGNAGLCVSAKSLAAVPAACLRATAVIPVKHADAGSEVREAINTRLGKTGMYQGLTALDCVGADGWYRCTFAASTLSGTANVLYLKAGPRVVFVTAAGF